MNNFKIYDSNELQYKKLELFSDLVTDYLKKGGFVIVETTYFDYGQNWKYRALITYKNGDSWQSVCPRDYELILFTDSIAIMDKMARYYAEQLDNGKIDIKLYDMFY